MEVTPETKVAALLDAYPELEDALIKLAPPFKKLKNPLLRRSVARVASLRQAASAARLPVEDLVNHLRAAVGQAPLTAEGSKDEEYLRDHPEWFDVTKISASITEGENDDPDKMRDSRACHLVCTRPRHRHSPQEGLRGMVRSGDRRRDSHLCG
jgi:hypothetical protein